MRMRYAVGLALAALNAVATSAASAAARDTGLVLDTAPLLGPALSHSRTPQRVLADESANVLGAPLQTDLASWRSMGVMGSSPGGGYLRTIGVEPDRELVWAGEGAHVVALRSGPNGLRPVGRSPALPGVIVDVGVGDGFAVAVAHGQEQTAWLLDTRDPTWPRKVRPIRVSGTVHAVAADGMDVALVVDRELVHLRVVDASRAFEVGRLAVQIEGSRGVWRVSMEGGWAAVSLSFGGIEVVRLDRGAGEPPRHETLIDSSSIQRTRMLDGYLYVLESMGPVGSSDRVPTVSVFGVVPRSERRILAQAGLSRILSDFGVDRGALWVLERAFAGKESTLLKRRIEAGGLPGDWESAIIVDDVDVEPYSGSPLILERGAGATVVTVGGRAARWLPDAGANAPARLATAPWRTESNLQRSHVVAAPWLVTVGTHGSMEFYRVGGDRLATPAAVWLPERWAFHADTMRDAVLVGDRLWVATANRLDVFDVSDPADIRHVATRPDHLNGANLSTDGEHVFVAGQHGLDIIRADAQQLHPPLATWRWSRRTPVSSIYADGHVWVGTDGTGAALSVIDVSTPSRPRFMSDVSMPAGVISIAEYGKLLTTLTASPAGLHTIDIFDRSDPAALVVLGHLDLDLESAPGLPTRWTRRSMIQSRGDLYIAHPARGVLHVDISVPELPDEVGSLAVPGTPMTLVRTGERMWVTTREAGIVDIRPLRRGAPRIERRLWLPVVVAQGG